MNLPYNFWKEALKLDAERKGILRQFDALGDIALELFYKRGCKPSIQSILDDVVEIGSTPHEPNVPKVDRVRPSIGS